VTQNRGPYSVPGLACCGPHSSLPPSPPLLRTNFRSGRRVFSPGRQTRASGEWTSSLARGSRAPWPADWASRVAAVSEAGCRILSGTKLGRARERCPGCRRASAGLGRAAVRLGGMLCELDIAWARSRKPLLSCRLFHAALWSSGGSTKTSVDCTHCSGRCSPWIKLVSDQPAFRLSYL
jgi:hypothetical protein